jgi:glycosyltransferase involved in cell wall biosynthesis
MSTDSLQLCIVTPDLIGPVRNGGIGTANSFLAFELVNAGYHVTIFFSQNDFRPSISDVWSANYEERGIKIVIAEDVKIILGNKKLFPKHEPLEMSLIVYNWLAFQSFDIVIFMDWQGHGFYSLQAKQAGLKFHDTIFITQTHSPSLWHALNNADIPRNPYQSLTYFMERKSIELADAVISPSSYMLKWLLQHGFTLPDLSFVLPNLLEVNTRKKSNTQKLVEINEWVFFGRLEYRKGLVQFCDALDRLTAAGQSPQKVTFLGKFSRVGQEHSGVYITNRSQKWPFSIDILARCTQTEALGYLSGNGRLAVMPSVADNSPYTVYECLVNSIPFIARDVGGVGELINNIDHASCLFNDNPNALAKLLANSLTQGVSIPALAFDLEKNRQNWRKLIPALIEQVRISSKTSCSKNSVLVSVCLTHYNRPNLLKQAVTSLLKQDYEHFEVLLVDDGSPGKESARLLRDLEPKFKERGWKILRLENGYLGRARNTAVSASSGEYLLFMDDDNVAHSNMISRFVSAAISSNADLVSCTFDVFSGDKAPSSKTPILERYLPVGDIVSFSVLANAIGDANSLMRRSIFEKLGGFSEDYGLGHEDFELFLRAVLDGAKVCVIPESLFWYRRNGMSMLNSTHDAANRMRSFRPFFEYLPASLAELAVLAHGVVQTDKDLSDTDCLFQSGLSLFEKSTLKNEDPDSAQSISALIKLLVLNGQWLVAEHLVKQLENDVSLKINVELVLTRLFVEAHNAANKGDFKEVQNIVEALDQTKASDEIKASHYLTLLEALINQPKAKTLVLKLIEHLLLVSNHIESRLVVTGYLLLIGHVNTALEQLNEALILADSVYLNRRQDVKDAVTMGSFSCGLDHYVRYGKNENSAWLHMSQFKELIPKFGVAIKENPNLTISHDAKHRFILAMLAFSN